MGKHTYNEKNGNISFFCIQPLQIEREQQKRLLHTKIVSNEKWLDLEYKPSKNKSIKSLFSSLNLDRSWIQLLSIGESYEFKVFHDNSKKYNDILIEEICNENNPSEIKLLNNFNLVNQESGYILGWDTNDNIFVIISFITITPIDYGDIKPENFTGLYYKIRNLQVVDPLNDNITVSNWTNELQNDSINKVSSLLGINKQDISIPSNTGYMMAIYKNFNLSIFSKSMKDEIKLAILSNHVNDDKEFESRDYLSKSKFAFFGWRFTTVFNYNEEKALKCIPVIINLDLAYFIHYHFFKVYAFELFEKAKYDSLNYDLDDFVKEFDSVVVAFKTLQYNIFTFKYTLRKWQLDFYDKTFSYWNLDKDFQNFTEVTSIVQGSIERKLKYSDNREQSKQSNILFVLALLQIFTIISVLFDYLGLMTAKVPESFQSWLSQDLLLMFGFVLPLILLFISLIFLLIVYKNKVARFFENRKRKN